jgi:hypothetical protein
MKNSFIIYAGLQLCPTSFEDRRRLIALRRFELETDTKNKELVDGKDV